MDASDCPDCYNASYGFCDQHRGNICWCAIAPDRCLVHPPPNDGTKLTGEELRCRPNQS